MGDPPQTLVVDGLSNSDFGEGQIRWNILRRVAALVASNSPIGLLDLSDAVHLKPYVVALVVAVCLKQRSPSFDVRWPNDVDAAKHLDRLGIPQTLGIRAPVTAECRNTNIPMRQLIGHADPAFSQAVTELLASELSEPVAPGTEAAIATHLDELVFNALGHSESTVGCVVVAQALPRTNVIDMTVVDLGITIFGHLTRRYPKLSDDTEAIRLATKDGITGTTGLNKLGDPNSGVGLTELRQYMEDTGGEVAILSGDALVTFGRTNRTQPLMGPRFMGTLVNVQFNTNH